MGASLSFPELESTICRRPGCYCTVGEKKPGHADRQERRCYDLSWDQQRQRGGRKDGRCRQQQQGRIRKEKQATVCWPPGGPGQWQKPSLVDRSAWAETAERERPMGENGGMSGDRQWLGFVFDVPSHHMQGVQWTWIPQGGLANVSVAPLPRGSRDGSTEFWHWFPWDEGDAEWAKSEKEDQRNRNRLQEESLHLFTFTNKHECDFISWNQKNTPVRTCLSQVSFHPVQNLSGPGLLPLPHEHVPWCYAYASLMPAPLSFLASGPHLHLLRRLEPTCPAFSLANSHLLSFSPPSYTTLHIRICVIFPKLFCILMSVLTSAPFFGMTIYFLLPSRCTCLANIDLAFNPF